MLRLEGRQRPLNEGLDLLEPLHGSRPARSAARKGSLVAHACACGALEEPALRVGGADVVRGAEARGAALVRVAALQNIDLILCASLLGLTHAIIRGRPVGGKANNLGGRKGYGEQSFIMAAES